MTSSVFNIAISGLNAAQAGLATTGHNIANATTPGFSRQQVQQVAQAPVFLGGGYFGRGVSVETVVRRYDTYLAGEVQRTQTAASHYSATLAEASGVDNLLGDPTAGLQPAMTDFFAALNSVATQPGDSASRQSLISAAQSLTGRVRVMQDTLQQRQNGIDRQLEAATGQANTLAGQIADINDRIVKAAAMRQPPNDLLDQRDQLVGELGKLLPVTTAVESGGAMNVYLGNGQSLVVGGRAFAVKTAPDTFDPTRRVIGMDTGSAFIEFKPSEIFGGQVGGLLAARHDVVDPAQNALGRIATTLADAFNAQHRLGQDRNGNPGGDFFTVGAPWIAGAATNSGSATLSASLVSSGALTASDYEVVYTGAGYQVTNLADNTTRTYATLPLTIDGVALSLASGVPSAGDRFLLRPTRDGAAEFDTQVVDPALVAAASPIRTGAASANTGAAAISAGVANTLDPNLRQPVTFTFTSAGTFDVSGTGTGNPANVAFTSGGSVSYNGWTVQITGSPKAGDTFTIGPNTGGVGDNRNAALLAQLQTARTVGSGAFTLGDAYGAMVASVGSATHAADIASKAQQTLLGESQAAVQSVSGVNLDEEAANLLRYQQAYEASSKVVQIAAQMFDSILSLGR